MAPAVLAMSEPRLTLVIPVYNAAPFLRQSLQQAVAFAEQQPGACEVLVSDDGSTDGSAAIAAEFGDRVRMLAGGRRRGKGHAVRVGVLAASGRLVVFTDADLPYGLEAVALLVRQLEDGGCDLVVGSRENDCSPPEVRPVWTRRVASRVFAGLVRRVIPTGVADTQCGLKGYRRAVARALFSRARIDGFAFDVEILSIAHACGLRLGRFPLAAVRKRHSSVRLLRDGWHMLLDVARVWRNHRLGRYRRDEEGP
ncbi:MAG: glycosyltransferase [Vicinamibacteria bacterium]|jgi:dolichyl-phosphate beta-glucosyltransferase|nr:glycosyltransferase [Vicinamibacteria bacterium]